MSARIGLTSESPDPEVRTSSDDTPDGPNAAEKLLLGQASGAQAEFVTAIHGELTQPGLPPIRTSTGKPGLSGFTEPDEDNVEGDGWGDSVSVPVEALFGKVGEQ